MRNSVIYFCDGPWENQTREESIPVPSEVIPVYADAQAIIELGCYRKVKNKSELPLYTYQWEPAL